MRRLRLRRSVAAFLAIMLAVSGLAVQAVGSQALPPGGEPELPEPLHVPKTGPDGRLVPLTVPPWLGPPPDELVIPRDRDRIQEEIDLVSDLMTEGAIDNWTEAEDYIQDLLDLLDEIGRDESAAGDSKPMTLWCYWRLAYWWACAP